MSLDGQTMAAIDTGTTNIGGPSSAIAAIYAQIPGSSAATGQWQGYYQYRTSPPSSRRHGLLTPPHSMWHVGDGHDLLWRQHLDDEFGRLRVRSAQLERVYRRLF